MPAYSPRARVDLRITVPATLNQVKTTPTKPEDIAHSNTLRAVELATLELFGERLPASNRATIAHIQPTSLTWTRNLPATPDELSVTLPAGALPFDLRILRQIEVSAWIWVKRGLKDDGSSLQHGAPGYFAGFAKLPTRDRRADSVTLECVDYTSQPMAHDLDPAFVATLDLTLTLADLMRQILNQMPGGKAWEVLPLGQLAGPLSSKAMLADEAQWAERKPPILSFLNSDPASQVISGFEKSFPDGPQGDMFRWPVYERRIIQQGITAKARKARRKEIFQAFDPSGNLKVWDAIVELCARMGVLPDVTVTSAGRVALALTDAAEYHSGAGYKRFSRQGRSWRRLTEGKSIDRFTETRDLVIGDPVDFVEVGSTHPVTGKTIKARYGTADAGEIGVITGQPTGFVPTESKGKGVFQFAHGITDPAHLKQLAQVAFIAFAKGEYKIEISSLDPWSDGGGPDDPDLLGLAPGGAMEIAFQGLDEHAQGLDPAGFFKARGLPPEVAELVARATKQLRPSLLFHCSKVVHRIELVDDGSYDCTMNLQTYLNDGERPVDLATADL